MRKRGGGRAAVKLAPTHCTTLQLASPLTISLPPTGIPKLTVKMGDHQPSADELGYHFRDCSGRSREARRDKKVYKDKEYPKDTGKPKMEQSRPYAATVAALSRPPRVTWGDPPPTAPVNRDASQRENPAT